MLQLPYLIAVSQIPYGRRTSGHKVAISIFSSSNILHLVDENLTMASKIVNETSQLTEFHNHEQLAIDNVLCDCTKKTQDIRMVAQTPHYLQFFLNYRGHEKHIIA